MYIKQNNFSALHKAIVMLFLSILIYCRAPIPVQKRICIALFKMASCAEYRVVGANFGVSCSTVHRCFISFSSALAGKIAQFITYPTTAEAIQIANSFHNKYGYPQAYGAIDGPHIAITPPTQGKADFINRKSFPSLVLQGVVDCKYKFRDISVRCPGSMHDARVFDISSLSTRLNSELIPKNDMQFDNRSIPLHLLADPAYPLSTHLIKPYVGRNLTDMQESFNVYHSSVRMVVENAFGRLKSRWRCLSKKLDCSQHVAPEIITAACILHNICEDYKVPYETGNSNRNVLENIEPDQQVDLRGTREGQGIRSNIATYLYNHHPLRQAHHLH
jgi:hypothetical protein